MVPVVVSVSLLVGRGPGHQEGPVLQLPFLHSAVCSLRLPLVLGFLLRGSPCPPLQPEVVCPFVLRLLRVPGVFLLMDPGVVRGKEPQDVFPLRPVVLLPLVFAPLLRAGSVPEVLLRGAGSRQCVQHHVPQLRNRRRPTLYRDPGPGTLVLLSVRVRVVVPKHLPVGPRVRSETNPGISVFLFPVLIRRF